MSTGRRNSPSAALAAKAPLFAALGDETRLALVRRLCEASPLSITRLTEGTRLTRQAITKHLRVLEDVGLVRASRAGRERIYALEPRPLAEAQAALDHIARLWDQRLERLKSFVESDDQRQ